MKAKIRTHLGTIPVSFKKGRKKPFRLRVTIGGKRIERYFKTRAEAETEWQNLASLAQHLAHTPLHGPLLSDHEAAKFLEARAQLAAVGLSLDDAVQLAILSKDAPTENRHETTAEKNDRQPALSEQIHFIAAEIIKISERLGQIENGTVAQGRVIRSATDAARYCGFSDNRAFREWAERIGFEFPRTKLVQQQRPAFLVSELEAAILRDPIVHRNRRSIPSR